MKTHLDIWKPYSNFWMSKIKTWKVSKHLESIPSWLSIILFLKYCCSLPLTSMLTGRELTIFKLSPQYNSNYLAVFVHLNLKAFQLYRPRVTCPFVILTQHSTWLCLCIVNHIFWNGHKNIYFTLYKMLYLFPLTFYFAFAKYTIYFLSTG